MATSKQLKKKNAQMLRRHRRVRSRVSGTVERPRLNVFRSRTNIFAQVIDDINGHTLASASTVDKAVAAQVDGKSKSEAAKIVGQVLAERAKAAGVGAVVFDRGGYRYHG